MRTVLIAIVCVGGCGSSRAPAAVTAPAAAEAAVDAAVPDAPPPDAGPSAAVLAAPAWVFRYDAPPRVETWTLRHAEGQAQLVVEAGPVTTTYLGAATPGAAAGELAVDVATATARMTLTCKPAARPIGAACKERRPARLDVLDCFHPDFAQPMTFAPAPGVVFDGACGAYRRLP